MTPPLEPGKVYHYTLRAESIRDGRPISVTTEVAVRAGEETRVELRYPDGRVARR